MTREIFVTRDPSNPTGVLELAFEKAVEMEAAEKRLDKAVRAGTVQRFHGIDWFADAVQAGVLNEQEAADLRELEKLTQQVIAVDHFDPAEVRPNYMTPGPQYARGPCGGG